MLSAAVASSEIDIATLTVLAADDPRTLNKQLVIRHKPNLLTFNSLVELWEKKIGHSLHKTFVPEAEVQKQLDGNHQHLIHPFSNTIMIQVHPLKTCIKINLLPFLLQFNLLAPIMIHFCRWCWNSGLNPNSIADFFHAIIWELVSGREIFPLNPSIDVDSDELYPDYKYVTVDEYFDKFVEKKRA